MPAMIAPPMVAVPARADPEGAVHSADPSTHRTADDPADRPGSAVAAGCAFLGTAD